MKRSKLQDAVAGGTPDDTEMAFYEALHNADINQLMSCWADEDDIVCVHPGGTRLIGASSIRSTFNAMFSNGSVQAFPERVHKVQSMTSAVHHLIERVEIITSQGAHHAYVISTNVYHKTPQGWKMVAHHASPGTVKDMSETNFMPTVLH